MRDLIVYPNASKGGVSTVIRGRALHDSERAFDAVFFEDRGGAHAFDDLPNVRVSVIRRDRSVAAINYMLSVFEYDLVSVLSAPEIVAQVAGKTPRLRYEFHSSDLGVVRSEVGKIDFGLVDEISVPTRWLAEQVGDLLPEKFRDLLSVVPNRVDLSNFSREGSTEFYAVEADFPESAVPLVWVGRFDQGKGFRHFARLLGGLSERYVGIVIVSLENSPDRVSAFLSECAAMGVLSRVRIHSDLPQSVLADLYRWTREREGWAVSTSLMESFGYFVAEATACGLRAAVFDLPVWAEHPSRELISVVPIGSVNGLIQTISAG